MNRVAIGYDHEFLILDNKGMAFPSTLIFPRQDKALRLGKALVYTDGRQGEHGNTDPNDCREYTLDDIWHALRLARDKVDKYNLEHKTKLKVVLADGAPMTKRAIMRGGRLCMISGCNPDYNAYAVAANPGMEDYADHLFAYAGAHYHVAWGENRGAFKTMEQWCEAVKVYDRIAGIPMVLLSSGDKLSNQRRKHYGAAGCHRVPKGRIEWRVPGADSYRSPAIVSLILYCLRMGMYIITNGGAYTFNRMFPDELVINTINNCDKETALKLFLKMLSHGYIETISDSSPFSKSLAFRYDIGEDGEIHGTKKCKFSPMKAFMYFATGRGEIGKDWESNWSIDTPVDVFQNHGETALGFIESAIRYDDEHNGAISRCVARRW